MKRVEGDEGTLRELGRRLLDAKEVFARRYRCLFSLMNVKPCALTRGPLSEVLSDKSHGALLRHEVAYVLGQMQDSEVVDLLVSVVEDAQDDPMVRHEAAEALGNIATPSCKEVLESHLRDASREVAETCQLALKRIADVEEKKRQEEAGEGQSADGGEGEAGSHFNTVDPIVAKSRGKGAAALSDLEATALDESAKMYDRYDAIFQLRDRASATEAIACLTKCLQTSGSALLKHEVAFVLGQLQNKEATSILVDILGDAKEHCMVRHEAAEALGSVAEGGDASAVAILESFCEDPDLAVAQSCQVALDMMRNDGFEYCEV